MSPRKTRSRQTLGTGLETVPFSFFRLLPSSCSSTHSRLKEKSGTRCRTDTASRPEISDLSSIRESRQCPIAPHEFALSHQSVRVALAIDDHHRHEPLAIQPPENPHPIQVDFLVFSALICADPALHVPRIPAEFGLLCLQEPMRQSLPDTVAELDLQP